MDSLIDPKSNRAALRQRLIKDRMDLPGRLELAMSRTMAQLTPHPAMAGVGFAHGFLPLLKADEADEADTALDAMLTEEGVVWDVNG